MAHDLVDAIDDQVDLPTLDLDRAGCRRNHDRDQWTAAEIDTMAQQRAADRIDGLDGALAPRPRQPAFEPGRRRVIFRGRPGEWRGQQRLPQMDDLAGDLGEAQYEIVDV